MKREDIGIEASEFPRQCLSSKRIIINSLTTVGCSGCDVALPLFRGSEVVGVLELRFPIRPASVDQLENDCMIISEVVSPVVVNSLVFERNRAATLTDLTTELPNRRAFEIALENGIAAAHENHYRGEGAVVAVDIAGFAGINQQLGFYTGDEVLCWIANLLRRSLREWDLLARSHDDEFLFLLPDAGENETLNIISRIEHGIGQERWPRPGAPFCVKLNFGWAIIGKDGETADSLIACARIRKNSVKSRPSDRKILLFPRKK